ncbi:28581_t:CDS:2, partial [Gigaspora margarita]
TQLKVQALIDSGTSSCFMDINLALEYKLPILKKQTPLPVEVIDRHKLSSGAALLPRTYSIPDEQIFMIQNFNTLSGSSVLTPPALTIPVKYHEFKEIFSKKKASKLPENCQYNCAIELLSNKQLLWGPIYKLLLQELAELKTYIEENLEKGFIRHSSSLVGVSILFVKKKNRTLRVVLIIKI